MLNIQSRSLFNKPGEKVLDISDDLLIFPDILYIYMVRTQVKPATTSQDFKQGYCLAGGLRRFVREVSTEKVKMKEKTLILPLSKFILAYPSLLDIVPLLEVLYPSMEHLFHQNVKDKGKEVVLENMKSFLRNKCSFSEEGYAYTLLSNILEKIKKYGDLFNSFKQFVTLYDWEHIARACAIVQGGGIGIGNESMKLMKEVDYALGNQLQRQEEVEYAISELCSSFYRMNGNFLLDDKGFFDKKK